MLIKAVDILKTAKRVTAFTGAGISVESGIPPFRGKDGLWNKVNPEIFDINFFMQNPEQAWTLLQTGLGQLMDQAQPNAAHQAIAWLENVGKLAGVITQNIDGLHQRAGSREVYEFHGSARQLVCLDCGKRCARESVSLDILPPRCITCGGVLKPDFVFFGEAIPEPANRLAWQEAEKSDCFILVGTTGEVMPACMIPRLAKQKGARIIEINTQSSLYTHTITDVFLQGKATEVMEKLVQALEPFV